MINFFKEKVNFRQKTPAKTKEWIRKLISSEKRKTGEINFIFCTDRYLKKINRKYLGHDYFTDVVTFDNSEESKTVSGEIYISIDRIMVNSKKFETTFNDEINRVMIHGVLHLLGYDDNNKTGKEEMRKMEDAWLRKYPD